MFLLSGIFEDAGGFGKVEVARQEWEEENDFQECISWVGDEV